MEKTGEIKPGKTPDVENRLPKEKAAASQPVTKQADALDDDTTGRLAKAAAKRI